MTVIRRTIEEKKQHIARWRASGLTRRQYCAQHHICFGTFRGWVQDIAQAEREKNRSVVLPVNLTPGPAQENPLPQASESVTLFLPDGIRISCHPSQLCTVIRALRHAQA